MGKRETVKHIRNHLKTYMKIFENMDGRCRQLAMSNPNRPFTDYCHKCQAMAEKLHNKTR